MKTLAQDRDKQEVLRRLAALRADQARLWGKMSCHQMICHLSDAFLLPLGEKTASPASVPMPRVVVKWVALYTPMTWPKNLATRPEIEQGTGGTPPVEFERDRAKLVDLVERFSNAHSQLDHPFFGTMKDRDWLRWGYLHCDHHLRQFGV